MLPRILHLDIETTPILAWVWGLFKPQIAISQIHQDWYMLCYAAKWHKEPTIYYDAIWKHKRTYKRNKKNDIHLLQSLWGLLDEADIVVAHNAQRFDVSKINAKFYEHGMSPPSPFKIVDTLKVARARFGFTSNRLDYIAKLKSFGQKLDTDFELWLDVMKGIPKQCQRMLEYNIHDVELLEDIYTSMVPWITNHPNMGVYNDNDTTVCSHCGSDDINYRGYTYTTAGKFRRFQCKDCGGWSRRASNELDKTKRKGLARNVPA